MGQFLLYARIRQAEAHVADIDLRVARQGQFVRALVASGRDASQAESLLAELRSFEAECIRCRDDVIAEFADRFHTLRARPLG
jgi:hypothetical protein